LLKEFNSLLKVQDFIIAAGEQITGNKNAEEKDYD
jgi:hypothetical protein